MTSQIPRGLIRVVSATQTEEPSDPADAVYERKTALFNFWKVHAAQSRATNDTSSIRCRQLFWRVWGDPRLSLALSEATLMQLWYGCQREIDLSPFVLRIESTSSSAFQSTNSSTSQIADRRLSRESQLSSSTASVSPSQILPDQGSFEDGQSRKSSRLGQQSRGTKPEPQVDRPLSNEASRKRSSITSGGLRSKARPSASRKRSSQLEKSPEPAKPRRSIIKNSRSSYETQTGSENTPGRNVAPLARMTTTSTTASELSERRISAFELPSASSWQSIESHAEPSASTAHGSVSHPGEPLVIGKNFRERFLEAQGKLRSSTNLDGMNRPIRKTGSVVRFADEVNAATSFTHLQKSRSLADRREDPAAPHVEQSFHRAVSEGGQAKSNQDLSRGEPRPWRPSGFQRHDSVGSVAAVSDDDSNEAIETLPRNKSHLSLGIADLKRSQIDGNQGSQARYGHAVTSPQIEDEQGALISGAKSKSPTQDEENLLAMGRKGGVTKAGGVNLPKELTVKGKFELEDSFDGPETSHF